MSAGWWAERMAGPAVFVGRGNDLSRPLSFSLDELRSMSSQTELATWNALATAGRNNAVHEVRISIRPARLSRAAA